MKNTITLLKLVIIYIFVICGVAFPTEQMSELLVINGDTLYMRASPLKPYLEKYNKSLGDLFNNRYGKIVIHTGCRRGYQGVWEIRDGLLYLVEIRNCAREKASDLKRVFGINYINNRVQATWFTGTIYAYNEIFENIPGKGYTYSVEKAFIIDIYKGTAIGTIKLKTRPFTMPKGFNMMYHHQFCLQLPKKMDYCIDLPADTICFESKKRNLALNGKIIKHDLSPEKYRNRENLLNALDSLCISFIDHYDSQVPLTHQNQNWGHMAWADVYSKSDGGSMRIIIKECIDKRIILVFQASDKYKKKFREYADTITNSITLMWYGD